MENLIASLVVPYLVGHFGSSFVVGWLVKLGVPRVLAARIAQEVIALIQQFLSRPLTDQEKTVVSVQMEKVFRAPFDWRT